MLTVTGEEKDHSVVRNLPTCVCSTASCGIDSHVYAIGCMPNAVHHLVAGGELRCSFPRGFSQSAIVVLLEELCSRGRSWGGGGRDPLLMGERCLPPSAQGTPDPCRAPAGWQGAGFQRVPAGLAPSTSKAEQKQGNSALKAANSPCTPVLPNAWSRDFN